MNKFVNAVRILAGVGLLTFVLPGWAATVTTLHSFTGGNDGSFPHGALVEGGAGSFNGLTSSGGTNGFGVAYRITPRGRLTPLWQFRNGNDGGNPWGGLVIGRFGGLFGTAGQGGQFGLGTVYKIIGRGRLMPLWQFLGDGDGGAPFTGLVQGSDTNFYGTSLGGPASIYGTVFKISPRGTMTPLHQFSGNDDGASPFAVLVEGRDGNFYGTTLGGPGSLFGTVFKITPEGTVTPLYQFTGGLDGGGPVGLVQGIDGDFYGTTSYGGLSGNGVVYKIAFDGTFTPLYQFTGLDDGGGPFAALVQGSDTNFYGTTANGGTNDLGTVFMITPTGALTTLYQFSGLDGAGPAAALIQASDGNFYGTTVNGGTNDAGTVFRLSVSP